jgi:hypothetical protein
VPFWAHHPRDFDYYFISTTAEVEATHARLDADALEEVGGVGPAGTGKQPESLMLLMAPTNRVPLHAAMIWRAVVDPY